MENKRGPTLLVTAMPEIRIEDGHMVFCVPSGDRWVCNAYPISLITRINRDVTDMLAEHYAGMGKVFPFRDDTG